MERNETCLSDYTKFLHWMSGVSLGCFKMHFHPLIKAIVFSSVLLGELMNMCDFRRIPRKSHMFIGSPKGIDGKTMALIKGWKCLLQQPKSAVFFWECILKTNCRNILTVWYGTNRRHYIMYKISWKILKFCFWHILTMDQIRNWSLYQFLIKWDKKERVHLQNFVLTGCPTLLHLIQEKTTLWVHPWKNDKKGSAHLT